jgi:predicted ATPase
VIRLIEALRYRSLRYTRQELAPFQVLVGPNASGKSTFLDVIRLLGDLLRKGLAAVRERSPSLQDLVWMGQRDRFEVAIELEIPEDRRERLRKNGYTRARYDVAVGHDAKGELAVCGETLWLKPEDRAPAQRFLFPEPPEPVESLMLPEGTHAPKGWRKVVSKLESGYDYFTAETSGWHNPFRLGPQRLALANLPEDEDKFPVAIWVKRLLMEGVQTLILNSEAMRRPSPPGSPLAFQPDGSNLPLAVKSLRSSNPENFQRWIDHVRTAIPDIKSIDTVERPEDKHHYLQVLYRTGLRAPSWTISDGTLRLLALTLVAYLQGGDRIYLIEEPENGIHPQAVETVFQSLSSAYGIQILCASHSSVILSLAEPSQVLCFARTPEGATDIVRGDQHPNLRDWKRGTDLGTLFASGVLG